MDTIKLIFPGAEQGIGTQESLNRALCFAVVVNDLDAVKQMIKVGADANAFDGRPLRYAIGEKNEEIINFLRTPSGEQFHGNPLSVL